MLKVAPQPKVNCNLPTLHRRPGQRPKTTNHAPHSQLDQLPDAKVYEALALGLTQLPDIIVGQALRAPIGSIGLSIADRSHRGPREAFLLGDEFAHLHPAPEASLHTVLPLAVHIVAVERGWAEPHPLAGQLTVSPATVLLFAPRGPTEIALLIEFVAIARAWASGTWGRAA